MKVSILLFFKEAITIEQVHDRFRKMKELSFEGTPLGYLNFDWNFKGNDIPFDAMVYKPSGEDILVVVDAVNSRSVDLLLSKDDKIFFKVLEKLGVRVEMYSIVNFEIEEDLKNLDFFINSYLGLERNLTLTFIMSSNLTTDNITS